MAKTLSKNITIMVIACLSLLVAPQFISTNNKVYAEPITAPESCFTFSDGTTSDYDGNNSSCPKELIIPSSINSQDVVTIGTQALVSKGLTYLKIPETVKYIYDYAFAYNNLDYVEIPQSVESIGLAFAVYSNVQKIKINGNPTIQLGDNSFVGSSMTVEEYNQISEYNDAGDISELTTFYNKVAKATIIESENQDFINSHSDGYLYTPTDLGDSSVFLSLINPTPITVNYTNEVNQNLLPSKTYVGKNDSGLLESYKIVDIVPNGEDVDSNVKANVFFAGSTLNVDAPEISGYQTPAPVTFTTSSSNNVINMIYKENSSPDDGDDTNPVVPDAPNTGFQNNIISMLFI